MSDDIDKLERLIKHKEEGLITEAEFETLKEDLFSKRSSKNSSLQRTQTDEKESLNHPFAILIFVLICGILAFAYNSYKKSTYIANQQPTVNFHKKIKEQKRKEKQEKCISYAKKTADYVRNMNKRCKNGSGEFWLINGEFLMNDKVEMCVDDMETVGREKKLERKNYECKNGSFIESSWP